VSEVIHIVGLDVQVGYQRRQRCSWCGALIDDVDPSRVMVQVEPGEEAGPLPIWPVGELIALDGGTTRVVDHKDGEALPANCCFHLDHGVTR